MKNNDIGLTESAKLKIKKNETQLTIQVETIKAQIARYYKAYLIALKSKNALNIGKADGRLTVWMVLYEMSGNSIDDLDNMRERIYQEYGQ